MRAIEQFIGTMRALCVRERSQYDPLINTLMMDAKKYFEEAVAECGWRDVVAEEVPEETPPKPDRKCIWYMGDDS